MNAVNKFAISSLLISLLLVCSIKSSMAQGYLSQSVKLEANHQPLQAVLDSVGKKAGFIFSYNSTDLSGDSLVSFKGEMPVETMLDQLLQEKYDYKVMPGYVILRYAPYSFRIETQPPVLTRKGVLLSGVIVDEATGKKLKNVSIYEKTNLRATLTDKNGYFQMPLMSDSGSITLTVSKQWYHEIVMTILPTVKVDTKANLATIAYPDTSGTSSVNRSFFGKMFISTKQRIQSLNISDFMAHRSYQFSVIPKWNTRGDMSGQVISKFSLNLLAGYNAGVHGFEMGTIANLNRTEVDGVQLSGIMNVVGGQSHGFQAAGITNQVYQEGHGVQLAGLRNKVNRSFSGMQAAGLYNRVGGKMEGVQLAGILNKAGHLTGTQISGVINKAGTSSGFQLGVVNLLDTASGTSIGLVNIARHGGFYQFSIYANESSLANIAFKSGREAFYSKVLFGIGNRDASDFYFGFGVGHIFPSKGKMKISWDGAIENYMRHDNDKVNLLFNSSLEFHFPIANGFGVFVGPSINVFGKGQDPKKPIELPMKGYPTINRNHDVSGWVGINAGIDIL